MKIAVTSDWHGYLPPEVPDCDLMLVAGDIGLDENFAKFDPPLLMTDRFQWLKGCNFPVVAVAGNHDFRVEILKAMPWIYLQDEMVEICGLKIWGSPWSNPFGHGWAFNMTEEDQAILWSEVPRDVDVIISHGPPQGRGDLVGSWRGNPPQHVGSEALRDRMWELPKLKLVACGHIHCSYGQSGIVVNGSLVNEEYEIANPPIIVEINV